MRLGYRIGGLVRRARWEGGRWEVNLRSGSHIVLVAENELISLVFQHTNKTGNKSITRRSLTHEDLKSR